MVNKAEFDIKMTIRDMYRFNLYHAYHNSQGILSIVLAIMICVIAVLTWGDLDMAYSVLYLFFAGVLLLYIPVTLRGKSKLQVEKSPVFKQPLHYVIDEQGITTSQGDASATMPWKQVYKLVSTKHAILVYGSRIRANVIPRDQIGEHYAVIFQLAKEHMDGNRMLMKEK